MGPCKWYYVSTPSSLCASRTATCRDHLRKKPSCHQSYVNTTCPAFWLLPEFCRWLTPKPSWGKKSKRVCIFIRNEQSCKQGRVGDSEKVTWRKPRVQGQPGLCGELSDTWPIQEGKEGNKAGAARKGGGCRSWKHLIISPLPYASFPKESPFL